MICSNTKAMVKRIHVAITFYFLFVLSSGALFSQTTSPIANFDADCATDFWTITQFGEIQQWSLSGGVVTGGDTILTGGGRSLSYCGPSNSPTFYTDNWNQNQTKINYYVPGTGWVNIPGAIYGRDNGGHLNDQYYMESQGNGMHFLNYWDGTTFTIIDSLQGESVAGIFDIAVDTSGHAWLFTGATVGIVIDSLKVYNQTGKINSYSFPYEINGHGSFFLNDTLYIGTIQDSIYPIITDGSQAILGEGIPFSNEDFFMDMASCQETEPTSAVSDHPNRVIKIFPNPTNRYLTLPVSIKESEIFICNYLGQMIDIKLDGNILDLEGQPSGIYYVRIDIGGRLNYCTVIKY